MINIGLIGLGGMGTVHYDNYKLIKECQVVAVVCSSEESKKKARQLNLRSYDDIASMIDNEDIDVVDICTPTYLHKEHVIESLKHEKHVIVEKPLALNTRDAQEIYDLASMKNCLLFVAQVVQFTNEAEILRNLVRSREYGKVIDGYFSRLSGCPKWIKNGWLFQENKSGVIPFDLHVHDLDLIVSLFGKPKRFTYESSGRKAVSYKESYRINYAFENFSITAEAAWYNANYPFKSYWRIYFEEALLENDGGNLVLFRPDSEPYTYTFKDKVKVPTDINLPSCSMFYKELSHFISCIEKGVPSDIVSDYQIITSIEILERILKQNNR